MNKQTEALKMAIEALSQDEGWFEPEAAIQACKEALEQPSWQGLSDDDMSIIFDKFDWKEVEIAGEYLDLFKFTRAIEQTLKEKNHDT